MQIELRHIKKAVAEIGGVTVDDINGKTRLQPIARYRQITYWLARKRLGMSLKAIAFDIGDRDHTTISHGVQVVEEYPRHEGHRIAADVMRLAYEIAMGEKTYFLRHGKKLKFTTTRKELT